MRNLPRRRIPHALAALLLLLAALALGACGSSSKSASTATASAATHSTATGTTTKTTSTGSAKSKASTGAAKRPATAPPPKTPTGIAAKITGFRGCMQRNGVTLPQPGKSGSGASQLPPGVTRAQYQAALKKCRGGLGLLGGLGGGASSVHRTGVFRNVLSKFAACMRAHGINLPAPSATGMLRGSRGVNIRSPRYKAALKQCQPQVRALVFPRAGVNGRANGSPAPSGRANGSPGLLSGSG